MQNYTSFNKQQGTALVVTLLLLLVMTLIVISGSRNTSMQLRMASNLQSRIEAQQLAQAGLDYVASLKASQVAGASTVCSSFNPEHTCDVTVDMPAPFDNSSPDGTSWLYLRKDDAGLAGGCGRALSVSVGTFECDFFEAYSTYDNTKNGQGRSTLGNGMMRVVPKS